MRREMQSFAMHRQGTIFQITLVVKPVPYIQNDIQYIGLIKPINRDLDFILTDEHGKIDTISAGIQTMLPGL